MNHHNASRKSTQFNFLFLISTSNLNYLYLIMRIPISNPRSLHSKGFFTSQSVYQISRDVLERLASYFHDPC